ncbi:hypothetical protein COCMIDRAFT_41291 [Bipolaris oryzae ATCC 44560]|uniref:Secreted protein n=1 Tax=Bipolaris oryzae ATCC 44560 TaxID=930090 RepID=W6YS82_COCMI|nr:uncharacterized protein COCMIDRAFT_41291 [Bipolaris oryzae ATCC 44560]EUC40368.1 hypothetical protein COCMIDRAFT_41291 [Bipolaris oryzae ATCC 44560]
MCGTATPLPLARSLFLFLSLHLSPLPSRLGRKLPHTMPRPILNTSHSPTLLGSLAGPANGYRFHTGHKRELMDWPSLRVHSYLSVKVHSFAHNPTSACGFGLQEREAWLHARLIYASP